MQIYRFFVLIIAALFLNVSTAHARFCSESHLLERFLTERARTVSAPEQQSGSKVLEESLDLLENLKLLRVGKAPAINGPREETLDFFIAQAEARERAAGVVLPDFSNPRAHHEASKTWAPITDAPKFYQDLLPPGVGFISHSLYGTMAPGLVKADNTHSVVSLRVTLPIQRATGEIVNISTNIGVQVSALLANAGKPPGERKLVSDEMESFYVSNHGIGTKGTGHHVDIEKSNYFGRHRMGVLSVDSPWHAEGSTELKDFAEEKLFIKALVENYVPQRLLEQRRMIYGGHSGGGQRALMMKVDPGPLEPYLGMIVALSPLADTAPGRPLREKEAIGQEVAARVRAEGYQGPLAKSDLQLEADLVGGNKISQSGLLGYYLTTIGFDLAPRAVKNNILTLFVMGKGDPLTGAGYEPFHQRFISEFDNVIPLWMGERVGFNGQSEIVGHMVMENRKPSAMPPEYNDHPKLASAWSRIQSEETEVYGLMRVLTEDMVGKKIPPAPKLDSEIGVLSRLIIEYANNTAYREFERAFVHYKIVASKKGETLQKLYTLISKKLQKRVRTALAEGDVEKARTAISENQAELKAIDPDFILTVENFEQAFAEVFARMSRTYVPEGPQQAEVKRTLAARADAERLATETNYEKAALLLQLRGGDYKKFDPAVVAHLAALGGKRFDLALINSIITLNMNRSERNTEYLHQLVAQSRTDEKGSIVRIADRGGKEDPIDQVSGLDYLQKEVESEINNMQKDLLQDASHFSEHFRRTLENLDEVTQAAREDDKAFSRALEEYVFSLQEAGTYTIEQIQTFPANVQAASDRYSEKAKLLIQRQQEFKSILEKEGSKGMLGIKLLGLYARHKAIREYKDSIQKRVNDLEYIAHKATVQSALLDKDYSERLAPGYFQIQPLSLAELVQSDFATVADKNSKKLLEPAWSRWKSLWGERPPPAKVEIY